MDKSLIRKTGLYVLIVVFFTVLSYFYAYPVLQDKVVNQSDVSGFMGMSHEMYEHNAANPDEPTYWTDAMFGGMPTTSFDAPTEGDFTHRLYNLLITGKRPASYLLIALLGGFLLMLALGTSEIAAVGGAIATAFCSYNFQIITAGHNTKMMAIAFLPWVLAGVIFTYKQALSGKKNWFTGTLLGSALFALALDFQIKANHQQITYYLALMIFIYVIFEFIWMLASHKAMLGRFCAASGLLLVLGLFGIGTNANKLVPLYDYTQYTMRGGSELKARAESGSSKGLDLEYATQWSYGWEELPNLLIPNFNGGSSSLEVDENSNYGKAVKKAYDYNGYKKYRDDLRANKLEYIKQGYSKEEVDQAIAEANRSCEQIKAAAKQEYPYWGPQPFTAGPMYMGAISVFLFLLGMIICKGKERWWMLAASILAIFLGLGSHMMWFTKLFFNFAPMYNKFRTVSMALIVLQYTLPVLGFLVLDRIFRGDYDKAAVKKGVLISAGVTAGFCLLCLVVPSIAGDFTGASDSSFPAEIAKALKADRMLLLREDALVSMALIICAAVIILIFGKKEKSAGMKKLAMGSICVLVLLNLFVTGKRYLNADNFTDSKAFNEQHENGLRYADEVILKDSDLSYRVFDLSRSPFNDAATSYWHKSVGGYSPAKMQRYQDLIDQYLSKGVINAEPVFDMLNTKYFITNGEGDPILNPNAFGNAWFVDGISNAETPDDELDALGTLGMALDSIAVIGSDFAEARAKAAATAGNRRAGDRIEMVSYAPNRLKYSYSTSAERTAVFSEIYHPGWKMTIDGQDAELFRADWVLRAAVLPAGSHEIEMVFRPESYVTGSTISLISSIAILLSLAAAIAVMLIGNRKKKSL